MTGHVWIGDNRYQVTDGFDSTPGSDDMQALTRFDDWIVSRLADPEVQERLEQKHAESHARRCCREHGTHVRPHRGCILR